MPLILLLVIVLLLFGGGGFYGFNSGLYGGGAYGGISVLGLVLIVLLRPWVARVPVAALVAIMITISISTFSWSSFRDLARHPKVSSIVMLATVVVTVATSDLAAGVVVGVLLSGVFFAFKVMRLMSVDSFYDAPTDTRVYRVTGQIFFASADMFAERFDLRDTARQVRIDVGAAVAALQNVTTRMRRHGIRTEVVGLNEASATLVDRHGTLVHATPASRA